MTPISFKQHYKQEKYDQVPHVVLHASKPAGRGHWSLTIAMALPYVPEHPQRGAQGRQRVQWAPAFVAYELAGILSKCSEMCGACPPPALQCSTPP